MLPPHVATGLVGRARGVPRRRLLQQSGFLLNNHIQSMKMADANSPPTSELDHIPTAWLLTGLVVFPFMIYQLLGFLSSVIYKLQAMRISEVRRTIATPASVD